MTAQTDHAGDPRFYTMDLDEQNHADLADWQR